MLNQKFVFSRFITFLIISTHFQPKMLWCKIYTLASESDTAMTIYEYTSNGHNYDHNQNYLYEYDN